MLYRRLEGIPTLYIPWLARRILQRLLQPLALPPGQLFQPVAVGVAQGERLTPGVVAVADLMPVLQGPAQHHIAELRIAHRPEGRLGAAGEALQHFQRAQFVGVLAAVEDAAGGAQHAADQGTGPQRVAGGERVDAGPAQGAGAEAGGGQVGAADAPGPAGLFAEQVAARLPRQGLLAAAQVAMLVKGFHVAAQALLPLALPVPPALPEFVFERVAVAVVAQPAGFPVGEHVRQGGGDQLQGLALADMLTLRESLGELRGKRLALAWVHSPEPATPAVAHSLLCAALRAGMDVSVAHPPGYELDPGVLSEAAQDAEASGASLRTGLALEEGVSGAHAVYARSWASLEDYGNPTLAASRRGRLTGWEIDEALMARGEDARLLHAMPIRRNLEVTDAILDGSRSLVYDQAENRLHTQKALLTLLLRGSAE